MSRSTLEISFQENHRKSSRRGEDGDVSRFEPEEVRVRAGIGEGSVPANEFDARGERRREVRVVVWIAVEHHEIIRVSVLQPRDGQRGALVRREGRHERRQSLRIKALRADRDRYARVPNLLDLCPHEHEGACLQFLVHLADEFKHRAALPVCENRSDAALVVAEVLQRLRAVGEVRVHLEPEMPY